MNVQARLFREAGASAAEKEPPKAAKARTWMCRQGFSMEWSVIARLIHLEWMPKSLCSCTRTGRGSRQVVNHFMSMLKQVVEGTATRAGRYFNMGIQFLIVVSMVSFSLDTLPNLSTRIEHELD